MLAGNVPLVLSTKLLADGHANGMQQERVGEVLHYLVDARLCPIGPRGLRRRELPVLAPIHDPPDAPAYAIAPRVIERHLVVADDAVVKIGDIQRPVRPELDVARPEPRV